MKFTAKNEACVEHACDKNMLCDVRGCMGRGCWGPLAVNKRLEIIDDDDDEDDDDDDDNNNNATPMQTHNLFAK